MPKFTRSQEREHAFFLLFQTEFQNDTPENIYNIYVEENDLQKANYAKKVFFGAYEKKNELDEYIQEFSKGWSLERITPVSLSILRLSVYEMLYCKDDVPFRVSINEAIELVKKYDDFTMKGFVNGILNSVKNKLEAQ